MIGYWIFLISIWVTSMKCMKTSMEEENPRRSKKKHVWKTRKLVVPRQNIYASTRLVMLALGFSSSLFLTLHPAYHLDYCWSNSMGISAGEENPTTKANFQEAKDGQNICLEDEKICCSKKENQQGQPVLCLKTSFSSSPSFDYPSNIYTILNSDLRIWM